MGTDHYHSDQIGHTSRHMSKYEGIRKPYNIAEPQRWQNRRIL